MDSAQRELIRVLLEHIYKLGLISKTTYSGAVELVHSGTDIPELFQYPARWKKEAGRYESTQNTQ